MNVADGVHQIFIDLVLMHEAVRAALNRPVNQSGLRLHGDDQNTASKFVLSEQRGRVRAIDRWQITIHDDDVWLQVLRAFQRIIQVWRLVDHNHIFSTLYIQTNDFSKELKIIGNEDMNLRSQLDLFSMML